MRALGNYMLLGRLQAVIVISLSTIAAMFVPPFSFLLSGVPAGLIILRKRSVYAIQILLICLFVVVLLAALAGVNPQTGFVFALGVWVPVYLCCSVLRQTQSQGWVVLVAGVVAAAYIMMLHWLVADVPAWWQKWIELWVNTMPEDSGEQYLNVLVQVAPIMNAVIASTITIGLITITLLSRWWQSLLFNPGGFRIEFYALRLPSEVIFLLLAGIISLYISGWQRGSAGLDILTVVIFMYLLQGLAAVHRIVNTKKIPKICLFVMYFLLIFMPHAILLVACLGLVDWWINQQPKSSNDNNQNSS